MVRLSGRKEEEGRRNLAPMRGKRTTGLRLRAMARSPRWVFFVCLFVLFFWPGHAACRDLSSPISDPTRAPCRGSVES